MSKSKGQSGTLLKEKGSIDLEISIEGIKDGHKGLHGSGPKGLEPTYYSILFYIKYNKIKFFQSEMNILLSDKLLFVINCTAH
jgi:hypothetical protein